MFYSFEVYYTIEYITTLYNVHLYFIGEVKTLMIQLLRAVHHLHDNWILHRDLKTSNLLLSHKGILKVYHYIFIINPFPGANVWLL